MTDSVHFPWETLDAIIGGRSAIDVPALNVGSLEEAESFLECYGFFWHVASHRREIDSIRREALDFLQEELLADEPDIRVPALVRAQTDVRRLLLWASESPPDVRQRWACALLRVMHTVAHARSALNERFGRQIRAQILSRFTPHLHKVRDGLVLGTGLRSIPLARFEVKASKGLRSVVMKLLHKVESVAGEVFDRIGVRFVTRERFDAMMVVRYLRLHNVIMFANIIPARSRNTLLDIEWVQGRVEALKKEIEESRLSEAKALEMLRKEARGQPYPACTIPLVNPFSSVDYHSIQFTCRQSIRILEPRAGIVTSPWTSVGGTQHEGGEALRFFFPYEVQVLDEESYEVSRSGFAAHEVYKKRQHDVVKRRVLGTLLRQPDSQPG